MDDYFYKLESLPVERLEMLVKAYTKTIQSLEKRLREATFVAMDTDVSYCQRELAKKRPELARVEKLLQAKRQETKKEQV